MATEYAVPTRTLGERGFNLANLSPRERAEFIGRYRELLFTAIFIGNDAERDYFQRCLAELGAQP